jgi:Transglutaminase-like superfamily
MWERLQRFKSLDPASRQLFLRAWILLRLISIGLTIRGFRGTHSALQGFLPALNKAHRIAAGPKSSEVHRTVRMVRAAARYGIGSPTCLDKSLALWWLLERQGISATLRIGTRKSNGVFEAHAWVERDGAVLDDHQEPHFQYAAFEGSFSALPPKAG